MRAMLPHLDVLKWGQCLGPGLLVLFLPMVDKRGKGMPSCSPTNDAIPVRPNSRKEFCAVKMEHRRSRAIS
jgi:hypothetical protein